MQYAIIGLLSSARTVEQIVEGAPWMGVDVVEGGLSKMLHIGLVVPVGSEGGSESLGRKHKRGTAYRVNGAFKSGHVRINIAYSNGDRRASDGILEMGRGDDGRSGGDGSHSSGDGRRFQGGNGESPRDAGEDHTLRLQAQIVRFLKRNSGESSGAATTVWDVYTAIAPANVPFEDFAAIVDVLVEKEYARLDGNVVTYLP